MKYKDYEKFGLVRFFLVLFIIFFLGLLVFFVTGTSVKKYSLASGVVTSSSQVMIVVDSKVLSWLYRNRFVMIEGNKKEFSIDRVNKNILKQKKKNYHQVFLKINLSKEYQMNDAIEIAFSPKTISFWTIFLKAWEGG